VSLEKFGVHPPAQPLPSNEHILPTLPQTVSAESIERIVFGEQEERRPPIRLSIPKINVVAAVLYAGLTPAGAMDVPGTADDVAWFNLGPRPGEIGNAVISGHFGWKNGMPAVFDNLHMLESGDRITTEDIAGITTTFVVRKLQKLKEHEDAGAVFASNDGGAHLNLITCGGEWNKSKKSYSDRLVVFADKIGE
jgi:LPXTG-site transpeptidase (sortase) family protein